MCLETTLRIHRVLAAMQPPKKKLKYTAYFKIIFVRNDIVNKISNLSNINIVNVLFVCAGGKGWEGRCQDDISKLLCLSVLFNVTKPI